MDQAEFWKRKLLAYLHDPPAKPFDLWRHTEDAARFQRQAGLLDEEFNKKFDHKCDHMAAAADRFPFPVSNKSKLSSSFDGSENAPFLHPLGQSRLVFEEPFPSSGAANEPFDETQPRLNQYDSSALPSEMHDWANFFLHWRLWPDFAAHTDPRASFIPADTRIPDHTVWNHMALTSALQACVEDDSLQPALMVFQIGPVQDFIAQARSCRDLLSGSYLLSWLTAHAIKAVTDEIGPDCVISPYLRGLAVFDALHREELFERLVVQERDGLDVNLWSRIRPTAEDLLTPNLPNRFTAVVPAGRATGLALAAEQAAEAELRRIADGTWPWVEKTAQKAGCNDFAKWRERWDAQVTTFLQVTWQVKEVEMNLQEAMREFNEIPLGKDAEDGRQAPAAALEALHELATGGIPKEHRDKRYFTEEDVEQDLNNPAFAWASWQAGVEYAMAARRLTRDFDAWEGAAATKDTLSGKEEMIGTPEFWQHLREAGEDEKVFHGKVRPLGAINLIKRLWCHPDLPNCYLRDRLGLEDKPYRRALRFDDTRDVTGRNTQKNPYFAVLALDGDEMGKWIAGARTPKFRDCLSTGARKYFKALAADYEKKNNHEKADAVRAALDSPRPLFPSYHLQFSEALTNFSRLVARPVVEAHGGQLLYAGGDDVLALVPADKGLACAQALREAFRGNRLPVEDDEAGITSVTDIGCTSEDCSGFLRQRLEHEHRLFTVPGPAADVSCGIAIGHYKAPLQMLVREAQKAEKRAKQEYKRGALAASLYKRSGEIIEWGCKWDDQAQNRVALELYDQAHTLMYSNKLSGRFPYALAELLAPYELHKVEECDVSLERVLLREFAHVLEQQGEALPDDARNRFWNLAEKYIAKLGSVDPPRYGHFANLFLVETFIHRQRGEA